MSSAMWMGLFVGAITILALREWGMEGEMRLIVGLPIAAAIAWTLQHFGAAK